MKKSMYSIVVAAVCTCASFTSAANAESITTQLISAAKSELDKSVIATDVNLAESTQQFAKAQIEQEFGQTNVPSFIAMRTKISKVIEENAKAE